MKLPLVALAFLALAAPASSCAPTSSATDLALDTPTGFVYVVVPTWCIGEWCKPCGSDCVDYGGVFVESNGLLGLQRHVDETCGAGVDTDPMLRDAIDWPLDD